MEPLEVGRVWKTGILGAGHAAAQLHAQAWRKVGRFSIVAVADPDSERRTKLAASFGARAEATAEAVIGDPAVEVVAVLAPTGLHGPLLRASLDAGKHVYCEKPLTSNPDELAGLEDAVGRSGSVVAVGHNLRCHRFVRRARSLIQSGALGELLAIRTVWTSPMRERPQWHHEKGLAGSVLLDIGVHHLDLIAHLGGGPVESVSGSLVAPDRNRESATMAGRLSTGVLFSGFVSKQGVYEHTIQLSGTRAAVEFSCHRANSWRFTGPDHLGMKAQAAEISQYVRQLPDLVQSTRSGGDWLESYTDTWKAFEAALSGAGAVSCTVPEAAAAVRAVQLWEAGLV